MDNWKTKLNTLLLKRVTFTFMYIWVDRKSKKCKLENTEHRDLLLGGEVENRITFKNNL